MEQLCLLVKPGEPVIDSFVSGDCKFGFVEMRTVTEANNAMQMSGVMCYGRPVRVGRPVDYVALSLEVLMQCAGTGILGNEGDLGVVTGVVSSLIQDGPDIESATEVVVIKHMMSPAELACDAECQEIAEDTIAKCEQDFGKVVCLIICRPGQAHVPLEFVGQCLVQFAEVSSAIKAAQGLNRVKFDARTVYTEFAEVSIMGKLQGLFPDQPV